MGGGCSHDGRMPEDCFCPAIESMVSMLVASILQAAAVRSRTGLLNVETSSGHLSADMEPNVCRRGSLHSSNSLVSKAVSDCRDVHGFQGSTETSLERLKVQNCAEDVEGQHAWQHEAHEASEATDSLQQFPAAATAFPGPTESVCCCS